MTALMPQLANENHKMNKEKTKRKNDIHEEGMKIETKTEHQIYKK